MNLMKWIVSWHVQESRYSGCLKRRYHRQNLKASHGHGFLGLESLLEVYSEDPNERLQCSSQLRRPHMSNYMNNQPCLLNQTYFEQISINLAGFNRKEKEMATHFSILAWKIPWTEKPGRLQSTGSQRVGHDWSDLACIHTRIHVINFHSAKHPKKVHIKKMGKIE